ncbi:MAG: hypothetical protein JWP69_113 [Flaviaesturariibacter sp.]|nr:hypothetical protein [Flaviaesturariibacter sp.]
MKDHQFLSMEDEAQKSAIWESGVFLMERLQGFHKIKLYQLEDSSYIEVTSHTHFNVVLRVSRFTDTHYLEPYLHTIDVKDLVS